MSSFRADLILERMEQRDPDFRYMGVSDLNNECMNEGFKMDPESEKKIVSKLLTMIAKDSSGDVKGISVKTLAPLATKVSPSTVGDIIDGPNGLSKNIFSTSPDMEESKDISTIGLKLIIAEIPDVEEAAESIKFFITRLVPKLTEQIKKGLSETTVWFCLDIVNDLLAKWGTRMANEVGCFEKLQTAILPHLSADNTRARKKAIGCLGYLSVSLPDNLLNSLTDHLVKQLKGATSTDDIQTFIQALAAVSRSVGSRLGKHVGTILPLIFSHLENEIDEENEDELSAACEIKDNCFQVLEPLLLRAPKETDKSFEKIQALCETYLTWDPLVCEDFDDEAFSDDEFGGDDEGFPSEDSAAGDDDDMSWKVRKSAARCILVIIKTRPEKLSALLADKSIVPVVAERILKEREENVKLDLMATIVGVCDVASVMVRNESDSRGAHSILKKLSALVPSIVSGLTKELLGKSEKTKIGAYQLLRVLVGVIPDCLDTCVAELIPGIQHGLEDKASSPLKIETLQFIQAYLDHKGAATAFVGHVESLLKPVIGAASDSYYKVNAESLRALAQIITVIASVPGENDAFLPQIYDTTLEKLKQLDIDQEVKEGAIECTGLLISSLGDKLTAAQIEMCLSILVERLSNEVTRLATVKTFEQIACSKLKIDISFIVGTLITDLSGFLKKKNRPLKQSALSALIAIVKAHGKSKSAKSEHFDVALKEATVLVSEADMHLAHLALLLASSIVHVSTSSTESVLKFLLPSVYTLLKSSLLQGVALQSMMKLFKELVTSKSKKVSYDSLLSGLSAIVSASLPRQSFSSIAQCIAVLVATNEAGSKATISKFIGEIKSAKTDHQKLLALFSVAEIGCQVDLQGQGDVKKNILGAFDSTNEDIKTAASVAFGCIAVGNMATFFPEILSEVKAHPKRKYLLLGSLREVIVRLSESKEGKEKLTEHFDSLLDLLFANTAQEEEGTRNVVSECLGKLALINPESVVTQLKAKTEDSNTDTRACVTTAVKFMIFEKSLPVDKVLKEHVAVFINLLSDNEIVVRKSVLLSLNYIAHHKPKVIRDLLSKYLPKLYGETKVKVELIEEVDLGPFKHKVDHGLELRQAAFECMYTLLETCLSKLNLPEFISQLVSGLADEYDVTMLNHLILMRLTKNAGSALTGGLDQLIEPLRKTVMSLPKEQAVQQQVDRTNELVTSALRAIYAINQIPDVESQPKWTEFMKGCVTQDKVGALYSEIVFAAQER